MTFPTLNRDEFTIAYPNQTEVVSIWTETFDEHDERPYSLQPDQPARILDCGGHIGIGLFYYARAYPYAQVIAFEPDPINFSLLQRNVVANALPHVQLVQAAVAATESVAPLYGEFDCAQPDTRGNSLSADWGERGVSSPQMVRTIWLGPYLEQPVDYCKLDIEGREMEVLVDIQGSLHQIGELPYRRL